MNNISILPHAQCSGCLLCAEICPQKCISTYKDVLGFSYPTIDPSICIQCGKCVVMCPALNGVKTTLPQKIFAAKWKDGAALAGCSSGGVASAIATKVLESGGVYYGAVSSCDCTINYRRFDNSNMIEDAKGSKYVQSDLTAIYERIKDDLKKRKVLFIGAPCQCAAIEKFCQRGRENLFLVSFPCGGWTSTELLKAEVERLTGDWHCEKVIMRKRHSVSVDVYRDGQKYASCLPNFSYFMTALDYKLSVRESCWNCKYCTPERLGDIVLGDYWGITESTIFSKKDIDDGVSFVAYLTDKGKELFYGVFDSMNILETEYSDVQQRNPRLNGVVEYDKAFSRTRRNRFLKLYPKLGLKKAAILSEPKRHALRVIRGIIKYRIYQRKE